MSQAMESYAVWLADFYLLTAVLLTLALAACAVLKQPAQQLAIGKSALLGVVLFAVLSAIPAWSAIHLLVGQKPPSPLPVTETNPVVRPSGQRLQPSPRMAPEPAAVASASESQPGEKPAAPIPWVTVYCALHMAGAVAVVTWLVLG